ncbi:hypothetical protein QQX98_010918 [Neonectria punicea]|uniref:Uncharacterized protein n=1 Tax=Neonectria punicea TaxID=979145 RepID=A0ABR1GN82_9HYPO
MWDLDGDSMSTIEVDGQDLGIVGSINGQIGSPNIQVIASGAGLGSVLFRLGFTDGTTNLFSKEMKRAEKKPIKGFKIAFKVDIALDNISNDVKRCETKLRDSNISPEDKTKLENELQRAKDTIERFGKPAGDFSIQRLFLDFATSDISSLSPTEQAMPGLNSSQVTAFAFLIQQWLTANKTSGQTTLGYGLAVDPTKATNYKVANVLMPTWVNMQTYAYKSDPAADPKLGWTGDPARNCVVYCNMTEERKVQRERTLTWSGNFTTINPDKEKRVDGSAVIRKGLFLDQYIIPMLRQYNDDMQIVARTSKDCSGSFFGTEQVNRLIMVSLILDLDRDDVAGYSAVDAVPVPGDGRIKIRGYTEGRVTYDGYYTRLVKSNLQYSGNIAAAAYWQVDIVIQSTENDGMKTSFENQGTFPFESHDERGFGNDRTSGRGFIDTLKNNIDSMMKEKESICKAIDDSLSATGKLTHYGRP